MSLAFKVTFLPFSAHFKRRYVERFWNDISKCKLSYVYDFWWNQYIRVIFIYLSMYVCIYLFIKLFIYFFLNFYFFWSCEISISDDLAQASFKKKKCNVEYIQQCTFYTYAKFYFLLLFYETLKDNKKVLISSIQIYPL